MSTRTAIVTAAVMGLIASGAVQAQPRIHGRVEIGIGHHVPHPPVGARHVVVGGRPYWMHGGTYYVLGDDGTYVVVGAPVVRVLPHYRVVTIRGVAYYVTDDDVYYRYGPDGYVVVERPVEPSTVVVNTPAPQGSTVTIYAPKKDADGYVPVTLKKIEGGFLGPQGEFYPTMPRVSLLTEMYGLPDILRDSGNDRTYFIHVPNKDGQTYTRVELTRRNNGFVGPQGEFYPIMPSVAHLAEMYGTGQPAPKAAEASDGAPPIPAAETPKGVEAPKTDDSAIHVQIHKKNGQGTVDVVLKKRDNGYIGPQGEFYPEMPTPSELADVYGAE